MERPEHQLPSDRGRITIASAVVAQIVAQTVGRCYGVVGMAGGAKARVGRLLPRRGAQGISIAANGEGIELDLSVVVEHGLNLAEVAATIRSQVEYEVERLTGLRVTSVDVHIQDVRQSA
jgi:uncharacterized alkaline shock family protein YloU